MEAIHCVKLEGFGQVEASSFGPEGVCISHRYASGVGLQERDARSRVERVRNMNGQICADDGAVGSRHVESGRL